MNLPRNGRHSRTTCPRAWCSTQISRPGFAPLESKAIQSVPRKKGASDYCQHFRLSEQAQACHHRRQERGLAEAAIQTIMATPSASLSADLWELVFRLLSADDWRVRSDQQVYRCMPRAFMATGCHEVSDDWMAGALSSSRPS